ncbi:hypothetical protein [[Clostridium] hylemonae]|uniref:Secreted protein n=1 Tax=[Clostridium] hylemonae DSM 15053 TaxID=553973 RepID=C0BXD6_9FIRM|nr:hypothetical protein [[Clostridium] hylemonae]EEG75243.1 hypothetical protein CLOHYLEM_04473 [[Clostridium] hylemonae DSM 15053]
MLAVKCQLVLFYVCIRFRLCARSYALPAAAASKTEANAQKRAKKDHKLAKYLVVAKYKSCYNSLYNSAAEELAAAD